MRPRISYAEANRHDIKKRWVWQVDTLLAEIPGNMKSQFVAAGLKVSTFQQRTIHPAIIIGNHFLQQPTSIGLNLKQFDFQARRRAA